MGPLILSSDSELKNRAENSQHYQRRANSALESQRDTSEARDFIQTPRRHLTARSQPSGGKTFITASQALGLLFADIRQQRRAQSEAGGEECQTDPAAVSRWAEAAERNVSFRVPAAWLW